MFLSEMPSAIAAVLSLVFGDTIALVNVGVLIEYKSARSLIERPDRLKELHHDNLSSRRVGGAALNPTDVAIVWQDASEISIHAARAMLRCDISSFAAQQSYLSSIHNDRQSIDRE